MKITKRIFSGFFCASLTMASASFATDIIINNVDAPDVGFNDPSPAAPVGGNIGITVGEQRLIAYRYALDLWASRLISVPNIVVQGSFAGLNCSATAAVLAQAGALNVFSDFENAPLAGTWYGSALANAIDGTDIGAVLAGIPPAEPDPGPLSPPFNDEIIANFNGDIGKPGCLENSFWYYGLDNNPPPGGIDFLNTFMHEVGHGLGFQNFMNEATGTLLAGIQDVYTTFTFDKTLGLTHAEMTDEQRVASSINSGNVVWLGESVSSEAPNVLESLQLLEITEPDTIAGELVFGFANFGPAPTGDNFDGQVLIAVDDGGASTFDGCEALTNAEEIEGNIALIDRGACAFTVKALNAQAAGASAVIIANNAGGAIGLGGASDEVVIPTVSIGMDEGMFIRMEAENGVFIRHIIDPTRLIGADDMNRVQLNAPAPVRLGSSISHFDPVAVPNLLMEPSITTTLQAATDVDLTDDLFSDIGWRVNFNPDLPVGSIDCKAENQTRRIKIQGCRTRVENRVVAESCRISDIVNKQVDKCIRTNEDFRDAYNCSEASLQAMQDLALISRRESFRMKSCVIRTVIQAHPPW